MMPEWRRGGLLGGGQRRAYLVKEGVSQRTRVIGQHESILGPEMRYGLEGNHLMILTLQGSQNLLWNQGHVQETLIVTLRV